MEIKIQNNHNKNKNDKKPNNVCRSTVLIVICPVLCNILSGASQLASPTVFIWQTYSHLYFLFICNVHAML